MTRAVRRYATVLCATEIPPCSGSRLIEINTTWTGKGGRCSPKGKSAMCANAISHAITEGASAERGQARHGKRVSHVSRRMQHEVLGLERLDPVERILQSRQSSPVKSNFSFIFQRLGINAHVTSASWHTPCNREVECNKTLDTQRTNLSFPGDSTCKH